MVHLNRSRTAERVVALVLGLAAVALLNRCWGGVPADRAGADGVWRREAGR